MFVKDETSLSPVLARGHVSETLAVAALVVTRLHRLAGETLEPIPASPEPLPHDPPDTSIYPVWEGVSVTAAGHAYGPPGPPFVRGVTLRVGSVTRRLLVFGDRLWERSFGGKLVASEARPFEAIELSLSRAFGGGFDVPPGLLGNTDLPHPGFRQQHPVNPLGVGFYPDERRALGARLPNIERPDRLIAAWNDAPDPVAFSPCRELVGWRLRDEAAPRLADHLARGGSTLDLPPQVPSFRLIHHASPELCFDDVPAGTAVELSGLGKGPARFAVPPCPAVLLVRPRDRKKAEISVAPRLRALHVDADRGTVLTVHDSAFRYDPRRAPMRLTVKRAGS